MRDDLTFGVSLAPTTDVAGNRALALAADENGLDLIGIQDHPYVPDYLDTFVLAGDLLAATRRISVFPDVANLPLRPPALLAKTAAALDLVSGGRFELALGAGGYWDAITRLGVDRRTPREANAALAEAITVLRALWADGTTPVHLEGEYYSVSGVRPGPSPAHPIEIWTGSQGPRALALAGRTADGWAAPIAAYLPYEKWAEANRLIDEAALAAGRDPRSVRRIAQLVGTITGKPGNVRADRGADPVRGTAGQWTQLLARLGREQPFTAFVFWPEEQSLQQVTAFAREVAPEVRRLASVR
ncbi:N5,N10-methylene tetrahydromethanopterin reductase [Streptomyces camponoticapitis]|uniref:N5,N10-methylene tetrahydromethanopterin reductase n=1 Tax=Streptomyces camponoticapitis TaxID=1616125 RepID=A0ABQ2E5Z4_9ACTN|nr:LLM class flavin-dependent oxidoreductase [Streptomyces camponoticapitis]GGJ92167.1 N5,N10-methylene tetrahydromethanopterin reductase [Streptomyces camponoticapitis]